MPCNRFMLGCKAAAGIPVSDISKETQISRTYIYQQRANEQNYMESLDKAGNHVLSINIDKGFIERMVLSLFLDGHASAEGIQRNFASVFGLHISYGKISSILAEASERAERFDAGIPKAFPDICVQPDIFHELRPAGAELARLERKAGKLIADESTLGKRACGKRPQKKTLERLSQIYEKVDMAIQEYGLMKILFCWFVELTGFIADCVYPRVSEAFEKLPISTIF